MNPLNRHQVLEKLIGNRRPWRIRNAAGDVAELLLFDEIGLFGVSEKDIVESLNEITAPEILVRINSPGGSVFSGIAVMNALRLHGSRIVTRVEGVAASIASVVAQAGDTRQIVKAGQLMVHRAFALSIGDADDMREMADLLERQDSVIAGIYADRCGRSKNHFLKLMNGETWFDHDEALKAGLVDEIIDPGKKSKGPSDQLTSEARALFTKLEHDFWREDMQKMATRLAIDTERDRIAHERLRFNRFLESGVRDAPQVGYVAVKPASGRVHDLALAVVAAASTDLGISPPTLKWCRQAQPGETPVFASGSIAGLANSETRTVWLLRGLPVGRVPEVAAHETGHISGMDEIAAQSYSRQWRL